MNKENIFIREAEEKDIPEIISMIKELAKYEKLLHKVKISEENVKNVAFGNNKFVEILIAEFQQKVCGQVIFFKNFSTFVGKPGYYIEDLYVKPDYRGKGIGKTLLNEVIKRAKEKNFGRVEWAVLDWNVSAIEFYKNRGAFPLNEWIIFRLEEDKF
ncbi:MAG: GNAT family N-acetyltransferase [Ignavibacterium sp.]|nr:GNAT family N-acetyltransferase [Ignavibacterium sp.]MCX7610804.1 GNAT family N-acetyltransferase [Ignavibacterium sp.]MDW8375692.1 GNAT family N-acetyltransferase [Ignavibacteriales bacterium]